jgi:hypothetical protein
MIFIYEYSLAIIVVSAYIKDKNKILKYMCPWYVIQMNFIFTQLHVKLPIYFIIL